MQNINNNQVLKEDLVAIARSSKNKSCSNERINVSGEYYVTHDVSKKKKIDIDKIKLIVLAGAAVALVSMGAKVVGDNDFATEIRQEVTKTQKVFNVIGGRYDTEHVYSDAFVNYINDLSNNELNDLYEETVDNMREDGLLEESRIQKEVISSMERYYEESLNKRSK